MQEVFEKIIKKLGLRAEKSEKKEMDAKYFEDAQVYKGERTAFRDAIEIVRQTAAEYNNGWIPFTKREMTEDEKESFGDLNFMLDCKLPEEDEEILVTYKFNGKFYVDNDIFLKDGSECYLDSSRDLVTEAVAWRKKPEPYQPKGE